MEKLLEIVLQRRAGEQQLIADFILAQCAEELQAICLVTNR